MVSYVQPIFAPNREIAKKNIASIRSFIEYYIKNGYEFNCIFGGYVGTDELWDEIVEVVNSAGSTILHNITMKRFYKNYGKAFIVNKLVDEYVTSDYFLTADSDILYDINQPDIIARLIESFAYSINNMLNPAVIALNQQQNNCHILSLCYENKYEFIGKYTSEILCKPNGNGGIAGGCLFISNSFWKEIGGYRVLGVYASDDAHLMLDACSRGYSYLMSDTISVIHPYETNCEYANWKVKISSQISELNKSIESTNDFWSTQNKDESETPSGVKFSYIIPHSNTSKYRYENLNALVKYLRCHFGRNIEIIVSEQGCEKTKIDDVDHHVFFDDSGLFRKSKVINNGVLAANNNKIFIGDNDVIVPVESIKKSLGDLDEYEAVNPYNKVIDIDEQESDDFRSSLYPFFKKITNIRDSVVFAGGCFAIRKDSYIKLGGFDENFIGWGGEDDAFSCIVLKLTKHCTNEYTAFHLFHDRNINGLPYHDHYNANLTIINNIYRLNTNEVSEYCDNCRKNIMSTRINNDIPRKICFMTRSMSSVLYDRMRSLIKSNYPFFRNTECQGDRGGAKYLYDLILNNSYDWIINIDEDFFTFNESAIYKILDYMIDNNYDYCGISDGGMCVHRFHSPIVMNPFFNIFNAKKIRDALDCIDFVETFKYDSSMDSYIPNNLKQGFNWVNDNYEPYYPFFYWLPVRGFKPLYLESYEYSDGISTILKNHEGSEIGIHTWFTRSYGVDDFHTNRIDNVYQYAIAKSKEQS